MKSPVNERQMSKPESGSDEDRHQLGAESTRDEGSASSEGDRGATFADERMLGGGDEDFPELLTTAQVRAIFGHCSARTIGRWIDRGYLNPVRMRPTNFFHPDEVRELIRRGLRRNRAASVPDEPSG